MTNAVFEFSVPIFDRHLKILSKLVETAKTYANDREIEPAMVIISRLYPDMFTFAEQIRSACNTAKRSTARLVGLAFASISEYGRVIRRLAGAHRRCFGISRNASRK